MNIYTIFFPDVNAEINILGTDEFSAISNAKQYCVNEYIVPNILNDNLSKYEILNTIDLFTFLETPRIVSLTNKELDDCVNDYLLNDCDMKNLREQLDDTDFNSNLLRNIAVKNVKNLTVAKSCEEILELITELNKPIPESYSEKLLLKKDILEESYDVFNSCLSTFVLVFGEKEFDNIKPIILEKSKDENILNISSMLKRIELINSYHHIGTMFQSKSGLKDLIEFKNELISIISLCFNKCFHNFKQDLNFNEMDDLSTRKLDKWEGKLV